MRNRELVNNTIIHSLLISVVTVYTCQHFLFFEWQFPTETSENFFFMFFKTLGKTFMFNSFSKEKLGLSENNSLANQNEFI